MRSSIRIALATYERAPRLAPDDQLLPPAFEALGVVAPPVVWSDPGIDWASFDAVMIRSCWDYHLRSRAFHEWLHHLVSSGCVVWNSPGLVRWNADKHYLIDLAERGVRTVQTRWIPRGRADLVHRVVDEQRWTRLVLKPAVSASGYETHAIDVPFDATAVATIARVTSLGDALAQPFVDTVAHDGEYSFVFLDGRFSHAAIKRPRRGEFRVQVEHGGTAESVVAPQRIIADAARVLQALPETPLYARVDGVDADHGFELMELELIEPNLYFEFAEGAAAALAAATLTRLASR